MGLVDKVKVLDNFLNERYLEKEFTKERFDYNGIDYDGKSINTESYIQTHKLHLSSEEIIEVKMMFEEYQIATFKTSLDILRKSFVEEYISSYKLLVEKIAFGNSLRNHLHAKLESFRSHKTAKKYSNILADFIEDFSSEFVDYLDTRSPNNNSFQYSDKLFHRTTISKLYNVLIKHYLIDEKTLEVDFIKIFKNDKIINPVRWTGQTSELKYFIQLINRRDLDFEDRGNLKWRIAEKCFIKVSDSTLKKITSTDLRTYKITSRTRLKLDEILVNKVLKL